jgi:putative spermidine/putrescine transport system ATP-binding protein
VALARALITNPSVLLLDEPLSALGPFLRVRMRAELKRLQTELGISFVHVTHSQEEAMALSDLVVVMNNGLIEQTGAPRDVYNHPQTAFVARFIGGHNVLQGTLERVSRSSWRCSRHRPSRSPWHRRPHQQFLPSPQSCGCLDQNRSQSSAPNRMVTRALTKAGGFC